MTPKIKAYFQRIRRKARIYFAHCRNLLKQRKQTHLHQKNRRFPKPVNMRITYLRYFKTKFALR